MNKTISFFLLMIMKCAITNSQVLCVQCFDQNITLEAGNFNLITNGGFENISVISGFTQYFCPSSSNYSCNINNWTCSGGGANTYANINHSGGTFVPEGMNAPYFGNFYCLGCNGISDDTSCVINSGCTASVPAGYPNNTINYGGSTGVSLSQTVSGLTIGSTYLLEFWAGGEGSFAQPGLFAVDLGFGDIYLRNKQTGLQSSIGTRFLITFLATSSTHTIKFTNWGHISHVSTELILDDVRLYTPQYVSPTITICTDGIEEQMANGINVFPSPVTDNLNIKTNCNEQSEICIYDASMRRILCRTFTNATTINTGELANGMYLYTLQGRNGIVKNGKIIKE